jgi:type II secretory pathway component GspD/PulD (secretin)
MAMAAAAPGQQAPAPGQAPSATQSAPAGAPSTPSAEPSVPAAATVGETSSTEATVATKTRVSRQDRDKAQKAFLVGAKEMKQNKPRAAMAAFERAVSRDPQDPRYAASLDVAKQHLVRALIDQADKDKIMGHFSDAHAAVAEAAEIDPSSPMVEQHADELARDVAATEPAVKPDAGMAPPIELQPKTGRHSFHLHTGEREVIRQVLAAYGIQPTVDDSVASTSIRFDVDDADFDDIERSLGLATDTFLVPLDPARVLVAKNTKENHTKFDRLTAETIYLPGLPTAEMTETVNMAKTLFNMKTATAIPGQSALMVRGPTANLTALNATLDSLRDGHGQVQLDVRMVEVDRTKATNIGMILPTQTTLFNVYSEAASLLQSNSSLVQEIISSGLAAPGDWEAILGILVASGQISSSILSNPFGVFGGGLSLTGVEYQGGSVNLQLNSTDVHSVDQLQLRVADGEEGVIKVGEKYPIETSSYSSLSPTGLNIPGISTAGLSSTLQNLGVNVSALASAATEAVPQVQYQDVGLTLDVTPRIEGRRSVSLKFDLKLNQIEGTSINGLPVMSNREYNAITSVPLGQSAVLVSAMSRQLSATLTGIPGLSDIPGFEMSTNKDTNLDYSVLAIVITPHLVRSAHDEFAQKMLLLPPEP